MVVDRRAGGAAIAEVALLIGDRDRSVERSKNPLRQFLALAASMTDRCVE